MTSNFVAPQGGDIDYDTEFFHQGGTTHPISIGLVRWDGATYYAVDASLPWDDIAEADPWVLDNVLVHLPQKPGGGLDLDHPDVKTRQQIREELLEFAAPATKHGLRLWAAAAAYDHTVMGTLMGDSLMDWPASEGWPFFSHDLYQEMSRTGVTWDDLPKQADGAHNALADAQHMRVQREWLAQHANS